jgi:translocation and assembly module TamB
VTKAQSVPPASGADGPPPRRAPGRWLTWALAGLVLLAVLLVMALELVLANLDHPLIKRRLLGLVKEQAGLELDYEGLEVSLRRGLRARLLLVRPPPRFASESDTFVRVQGLDVATKLWRLALGERTLTALTAEHIDVAVVRDATGASTLSELFPARDDVEATPSSPLSQSLAHLPELELEEIALRSLSARLVQLDGTGARSVLSLSGLALHGKVHSGAAGLGGSDLTLAGDRLLLELREPARTATAVLPAELRLRAISGAEIAFALRARVAEQNLAVGVAPARELLDVEGSALFDAGAGKTTVELARLHALDRALAVAGRGELFDTPALRVVASGKGALRIESLPPLLEGVSVEGLTLDIDAREVSWDGTRIAGTLGARAALRHALLRSGDADSELGAASFSAEGRFEGPTGQLAGALKLASLATAAPDGAATLLGLSLDLEGTAEERSGAQELALGALLGVESLRARATSGQALALEGVKLDTQLVASVAELAARTPRQVRAALMLARASAGAPEQRLLLERAAATARLEHVAPDASAASGLRGDAQLSVSLPSLRVLEGSVSRAALRSVELRATLPLSLAQVAGTLSLASLNAAPHALRDLAIDFELHEPLAWSPEQPGAPRATVRGKLARFDLGAGHGALEALQLDARRSEPDRYSLQLSAALGGLGAAGAALPGRVRAELRAEAAPVAGNLRIGSKLEGEGSAALELDVDARFEHERLAYEVSLSAQKLEAFAAFLAGVVPSTAALRLADSRLRARATGDLAGVLRGAPGELPALAERPLANLRGKQSLALELAGLDYRAGERSLVIPELALELGSEHAAGGSGRLDARVRSPSLTLEGGGSSLQFKGLDYALAGRFDRPPDQGTVHVSSTLALASVAQSYLPAYPLERVRVSSRLEVERLRSILLRELALENAAAGTELHASGALELLPTGTPARATITGREALALQGRLEQKLAPLEALGYAARARGSVAVPFRLESGGLLAYRLLANVEAHEVSFANRERSLVVEGLNGVLPVTQEIVLLPSGPELSPGRRASPLAEPRFFDVHPFLDGDHFVTADTITIGNLQPLGPVAANVRLDRSDCLIDQLQAGFRGGQITGRVQLAYRPRDPLLRLRLNATGVRSKSGEVLDANLALSFAPASMTLDGKVQLVRASRAHVLDILDVLDPYHELVTANRVRGALALGYPKFVRFHLHDGAVDSKIELGGIAQLVRIDDIRAVPLGPILQRYVAPSLEGWLTPAPVPLDAQLAPPVSSLIQASARAPRRAPSP